MTEELFDVPFEKTPETNISQNMLDLAKKIIELREKHAVLQKDAAEVWNEKERLQSNLIEQMEIINLKSFEHNELGLITISRKIWGKVTDLSKAREYFDSQGITDQLLELRLKSSGGCGIPGGQGRLNEIIKQYLDEGKTLPEGIDYTSKPILRRSK